MAPFRGDCACCINRHALYACGPLIFSYGTRGDNNADMAAKGRARSTMVEGTKLSDDAIALVLRLRAEGQSQQKIGEQVGCHPQVTDFPTLLEQARSTTRKVPLRRNRFEPAAASRSDRARRSNRTSASEMKWRLRQVS